MMLTAVVVQLVMVPGIVEASGPSLGSRSLKTSAPAPTVHLGRRVRLRLRWHAWVQELSILSLQRLLGAWRVARPRAHAGHLLLIHREVLLVEVLNT